MNNKIMKKRRTLAAVLVISLLCMTGCGAANGTPDDVATNDGGSQTESETGSGGISKDDIKVGVLYISDPSEGSGYSYTHDLGVKGMQSNLGLKEDQIERKIVDDSDAVATQEAIEACISDGCNIIFTTSWGYMDTTEKMAEKYPEVYFSHGTGYKSNGKNFTNYFGRIYQARYLSGIVAGMNTKSGKIGYVAAQDSSNSEVTGGIDAFAIGVASVNKSAKIYVKITNSWYDAAKEKGVYGIGYNSDMSKETPDSCLTSVIWNWSAYYTSAVQSIMDGTWTGENYYGGMAEGLIQITDLASFAKEGTPEKVDEATTAILSGENNVFDGVLETNTGKKIGAANSTLDDATITGNINWYYKNVVIVK